MPEPSRTHFMDREEYATARAAGTLVIDKVYVDDDGHRLRRNDVVEPRIADGFEFYGRVNRRMDASHVEMIDCGKNIYICRDEDLRRVDYDGYLVTYGDLRERFPVYNRMPSLRKLKQMAAIYDRSAWRRFRLRGDD